MKLANIFLPQVDIVCDFCLLKSDGFFSSNIWLILRRHDTGVLPKSG